jgi:signal transduction histidine kinase
VKYNIIFKCDESLFNEELKIVLFRIFQEALTNVIHHAKATECSISLTQEDETLILEIADNGIGVTLEQIENPKSFGLIGIRERLYPYIGRLNVIGEEGIGTTLSIKIENFKKEIIDD